MLPDSGLGCREVHTRSSTTGDQLSASSCELASDSSLIWNLLPNPSGLINILKLSVKSPSLSPPYLLFQWYAQSNEILLNLTMKCWNSAFNAQDSRVIRRSGKRGWNSVYHQNWWKNWFGSQLFRFLKFHSQLSIWCPIMPKLAVLSPNHLTLPITLVSKTKYTQLSQELPSGFWAVLWPRKRTLITYNFYTDVMSVKNYVSKK